MASRKGKLHVLEWLVELLICLPTIKASINDVSIAFANACANGHLVIAKKLWQLKMDKKLDFRLFKGSATTKNLGHAFYLAGLNGYLEVIQWLSKLDNRFPLLIKNHKKHLMEVFVDSDIRNWLDKISQ